ncbi:hypothetical protein ACV229_19320 [Burkholderia sp. MR1-5-21]
MTELIILADEVSNSSSASSIRTGVPVGLLDPRHPAISPDVKRVILKDRYGDKLVADGLETGHLVLDGQGQLMFQSRLPVHSLVGHIFEAFCVRRFNDDKNGVGRNAFAWCTGRSRTRMEFIEQFVAIGTGFISTKNAFPHFYAPQDKFDIQFIRPNPDTGEHEPATYIDSTRPGGIQVKAIRGNELNEIITPLRTGRYTHVLTMLKHDSGRHSYQVCMRTLSDMAANHQINLTEKLRLENSIISPDMIGLDQYEIDDYYDYIGDWYNARAVPDNNIQDAMRLEIAGYKYQNGILIPDN